ESLSMILVVRPFFWPVLIVLNGGDYVTAADAAFGMDTEQLKVWFGILALVVVELGLITPPVGLNVFIISSLAKDVPMKTIFKGVMPLFSVEIVRIGFILAFPALTLFLPKFLSG
ncbi:MAG: TRAP transporter large permease subunit, partial [Rhodospirillales bacterium]